MAAATTDRPNAADQRDGFIRNSLELISAGWSYLRARFELATLEGREAFGRYLKALVIVLGAVVVAVFGYFFLCLAIVFAIATAFGGGSAWIWVTLAAALIHFGGAAAGVWMVLGLVKEKPFPTTIDEFRKDQAWLETQTVRQN